MMWVLALGAAVPAIAQTYTSKVLGTNLGISAMCKDAAGNVYTVQTVSTAQNTTQQNAQIVKYAAGTTTPTVLTGTTFQYSEYESTLNYAFGIGIDGSGNIFVTTYNDYFPSDGRDVTTYGNILKFTPAGTNNYNQSTWVTGHYPTGDKIGDFGGLVIDSHNNIFVDAYNDVDGKYEIVKYPSGSTTPSVIYTHVGDPELASGDHYSPFPALAIDPSDNLYVATSFDYDNNSDGGKIVKLTAASSYATATTIITGAYCTALACDASGSLYATIATYTVGSGFTASSVVKYASDYSSSTPLYSNVSHNGSYEPWGIAVPSSTLIFAGAGGGPQNTGHLGDLVALFGTPSTQASGVNFTGTTQTGTTINWTSGNGTARAVFVALSSAPTSTPAPVNNTTYTANTAFGTGGTQIGATGWYCVYNGTGATSVSISGLAVGTGYKAMVVEYTGAAGSENYNTTTGTNNPNSVTTISPTTINSLNRVTGQYTNASSVSFSAVFGAAVTGVTASNFSVTTTGVSGVTNANIGTPTTSDNITWTVPVTTGTGDGTIQLNLANATGLSKTISTSLPFAGQSYTIDKTAPTIAISAPSLSATNTGPVTYTVTYADANFNSSTLANGDITLNATGTATGTPVVSGSGLTRTVTISGITGEGTLGISIAAGTATDLAGNAAPAAGPSTTFTVDNTAPTISISAPSVTLANASTSVTYTVTYADANFNSSTLATGNITLNTTGGASGTLAVTGSGLTRTVTISSLTGNGTIGISIAAGTATDLAGNAAPAAGPSSTFTVDNTAPSVSSINIAGTSPTKATSVDYTVTFSEAVTGVDAADFTLTQTSGAANGSVTGVTGSGATYTVTVGSVSGNGDLRLDLKASGTAIVDGAGNPISGGFTTGQTYTIDNTPATLTSGSYFSNNGFSSQYAKVGDNITLSIGYNEVLQSLVMTIGGNPVSVTPSNGNRNWTGVYTETSGDTEGNVPWTLSATDLAGNVRNYSNTDFGTVLIFDKTPPAINIGAPTPAIAGNGAGNPVTYAVTYSDANFNYSTLSTGDITLNTTGSATGTVNLSGSGTSYTVTISNITGLGTLGISIAAGTAADIPGNIALAAGPSATFNVVSADATLTNLTTTAPGGFTPAFDAATTSYTAAVPNSTTTTKVTPTLTDAAATIQVRVNGGSYAAVSNGAASGSLALNVGSNPIDVLVTAEDGVTTKTYTITVTRAPSINALLSSLTFDPYIKTTAVSGPDYKDYTGSVINTVSSMTVKPVTQDPTATVTVNGLPVTSGTSSASIPLSIGANVINTVVTAQDGITTKTYSITVTRQGDALLSKLMFSPPLTITQVAGPNYRNYTGSMPSIVNSVQVTPTAEDPTSTIKVNGVTVASGATSDPIALNLGSNTINTVVTAADGVTTKTYSIVITRVYGSLLTSLKFSPFVKAITVSGPDYKDYTATVSNSMSSVQVTPLAQDPTATITVNGVTVASGAASAAIPLNVGDNTINTVVTAFDGSSTKTYSITITRGVNALLASLTFSPRITTTTVSGPDYRDYTGTVSNAVSTVTVTPVLQDLTSTVTINSNTVASGTASASIPLNVGDNTITTVVTAHDGTTMNTYSTVITRLAPPGGASLYDGQLVAVAPVRNTDIVVHQNVSPNGDGNSDVLLIDGITTYPENTLQIMSRNGVLVYEAKGYDNATKVFDGHSSTNGKLQEAGTYFYSLDYKVGAETKHKTGYLVLKY